MAPRPSYTRSPPLPLTVTEVDGSATRCPEPAAASDIGISTAAAITAILLMPRLQAISGPASTRQMYHRLKLDSPDRGVPGPPPPSGPATAPKLSVTPANTA